MVNEPLFSKTQRITVKTARSEAVLVVVGGVQSAPTAINALDLLSECNGVVGRFFQMKKACGPGSGR